MERPHKDGQQEKLVCGEGGVQITNLKRPLLKKPKSPNLNRANLFDNGTLFGTCKLESKQVKPLGRPKAAQWPNWPHCGRVASPPHRWGNEANCLLGTSSKRDNLSRGMRSVRWCFLRVPFRPSADWNQGPTAAVGMAKSAHVRSQTHVEMTLPMLARA